MPNRSQAETVEEYLSEFPPDTRAVLERVRSIIRECAPKATELMSYAIPTYDLNGRHLIHFAGYAKHIGLYPGPAGIAAFEDELSAYKHAKGSVQFPLERPLPEDLIRRIVSFRVAQESGTRPDR